MKEKVRTLVTAARELHGVVMSLEHIALAFRVRFAGQIISRTLKGRDGLTHSNVRINASPIREPFCSMRMQAIKRKVQLTDKFFDGQGVDHLNTVPDDEVMCEPREPKFGIDVRPVNTD